MDLAERIKKIVEYSGLSIPKFAAHVGFKTPQAVRELIKGNTKSLSFEAKEKIISSYPEINEMWLVTGDGQMMATDTKNQPPNESTILIPVVNLDTIGNPERYNDEVSVEEYQTGEYPFPREIAHEGDVVIPVYGDSMSPTYVSGSLVLIRPVPLWREYLEMGATYILELEDDRRIIKVVQKGEDADHYLLVSINPNYQPSEISKSIIRSVWRVIMSVRRESL